jgi:TRAP transporter TAXI family solute receptor
MSLKSGRGCTRSQRSVASIYYPPYARNCRQCGRIMTERRLFGTFGIAGGVCLVAMLAASGCSSDGTANKKRLSIATGGTGGVFYPYGGGIAKVITESIPNVEATAEVTSASVDNLKFLRDQKADLAFTTGDMLADAVNGQDAFEGTKLPLRALAVLYVNYTHVVTLASSPVKALADLKGKVVSTGSPGSGGELIAFRILEAAGINPATDIEKQSLGVAQAADALKDGKIEAFFWSGGLPTAAVLDLAHTPRTSIRLLSNDDVLPALQRSYGTSLYFLRNVPKAMYPGLERDVPVVSVTIVLAVHETMSPQLAYDITRTLFEHQGELAAIHPEAKNLSLGTAVEGSPAPFHEGAIRYYTEQNAWPSTALRPEPQ